MADGIAGGNANAMLSTAVSSANDAQLHTGPPGSAGTANVSSVTTREGTTWGSPSGGTVSVSNQPEWASWTGTNGEVVTDISEWSAPTSGTFELSMPLSASVTMDTGDSLTLITVSVTIPAAA